MQATLPWADVKPLEVLGGEAVRSPDGHTEARFTTRMVESFEVTVYVHTSGFSASIEEGVEPHAVFVILAKPSPSARKWSIDSIDTESLDHFLANGARLHKAIHQAIFRAVAVEMWRKGFNPMEIKGWHKYAPHWDYRSILEDSWAQR